MKDKELRRLHRRELLEIMLEQQKEIDRLQQELKICRAKLEDKEIILQETGSIAEAALRLNGVFEAAQKAIDQFTYNVKIHSETEQE